jgi:predicted O-methyltransferase YrrM
MKDVYEEYLEYVGGYGHPVSFETATVLYDLCRENKVKHILDMGSGFSSYVFSKYASECDYPVQVVSVDTNSYWVAKTMEFLRL